SHAAWSARRAARRRHGPRARTTARPRSRTGPTWSAGRGSAPPRCAGRCRGAAVRRASVGRLRYEPADVARALVEHALRRPEQLLGRDRLELRVPLRDRQRRAGREQTPEVERAPGDRVRGKGIRREELTAYTRELLIGHRLACDARELVDDDALDLGMC